MMREMVTIAVGSLPRILPSVALLFVTAQPVMAQAEGENPYRIGNDGAASLSMFVPERWGSVGVTIVNPSDRAADLLSLHSFHKGAGLQFGRQIWIPSWARRTTWYPVHPSGPAAGLSLPVHSLLLD